MNQETPNKRIIIKLGGSILVPENIDTEYIRRFIDFISTRSSTHGERFVVVTGGGHTARRYQNALRELGHTDNDVLDHIGGHTMRYHAVFIQLAFGGLAHPEAINQYDDLRAISTDKPVIVCGAGDIGGHSGNYDLVRFAEASNATSIVNLSNIDHIYSEDPKKNPNAQKYDKLSWSEYRNMIPKEWTTKMSVPFDPEASRVAEELGLQVTFIHGGDLDSLGNFLDNTPYQGTTIS